MTSTRELIGLLDGWRRRRIVVAGDFMLDRHAYGNAERLSPDAPVPVLSIQRQTDEAGGAANVCQNLLALRCDVAALGVVGRDEPGERLRASLVASGCDTTGLIVVDDRPTTVKQSFVGLAQHRHPQKMFRVDYERKAPLEDGAAGELLAKAEGLLADAEILCLEDYDKGVLDERVCQSLIAMAREQGVEVLVDPAACRDYSRYRGAACLTPNRTEAELATGRGDVSADGGGAGTGGSGGGGAIYEGAAAMARQLLDELGLGTIVLTLDRHGALLLEAGGEPTPVPTQARSVYDVTGAGDIVLATLAAARANGAGWPEAVALANTAAGLEVERFGCVPVELDELLLALLRENEAGKLRSVDHLLPELAALRKAGKRIAFTNGCFDILHAGHVQFLRQARREADLLVVGINTDESITRLKGAGRPVNRASDRVMVLSELESVDYIILFEHDTPIELIAAIEPDVLVKGADYTREQVVGHEIVEARGGAVVLVPLVEGRSTTSIIERIGSGSNREG
ncbi:MAG: D-glycero-beta-D-manno-heptose 1-phosphate adenylyltransferase [Phycisphaeraceae bacterium]